MAAVTALSTLGGKVLMDSRAKELWITRIADGTLKAGHAADISARIAVGMDFGNNLDEFGGFCLPRYDTDVDTAYTSGVAIDIVIPQGGHLYNILIENPGATLYSGEPLIWSSTVAALEKGGNVEAEHTARLFDEILNTSTFATIIWGV
ncbi:hypothetical protein LCGC14_1321580 [marine sediment metagenome]|uniref:Uncharacterized protein n=1 Tax=marine sediment metagenome TaxID=412755 RepID=A0A0F9L4U3_9ZZZZ